MSNVKYGLLVATIIGMALPITQANAADCTPHDLLVQKMNETFHTQFPTNCDAQTTQQPVKGDIHSTSKQTAAPQNNTL